MEAAIRQPVELCGVRLPADWTDDEVDGLAAFVSAERRERIGRFRLREDRMRSLLAELLARRLLARRLNIASGDIRFMRNRYGKPLCVSGPVHFNLSHSGDWVVAAVSGGEVGVDVERIDPGLDLSLASAVFTPAERAWLDREERGKRERFFELWTYKESYIKCAGAGMSLPLDSFSVIPAADGTATIVPEADGKAAVNPFADGLASAVPHADEAMAIAASRCRLKQFAIDDRHRLAVCSHGWPLDGVTFRELPFRDLVASFAERRQAWGDTPYSK